MTSDANRRVDQRVAKLPARLRWAIGAARLTLHEPTEGIDRIHERAHRALGHNRSTPPPYVADPRWQRTLHERLGAEWPCPARGAFDALWNEITEDLSARGITLGRAAFGGWDDADPALARAVWCLTTHMRPEKVVETGVARGITSRVILDALARNDSGHLWSIDRPAPDPVLHSQIAIAVPDHLRTRWTFIKGTSRRWLPPLLKELGGIDLFVHDSSHTERNVSFELAEAWTALTDGAIVADDISLSTAFATFGRAHPESVRLVAHADDESALIGIALKRPA
jgi:predicted O-methyltransferase YrrM